MATKSVMDQIVNSLAFVVEATPQDTTDQLASKSNITPLNLKVRVRKKTQGGIEHGVISIPRNSSNDAPERIRLISSDQTIMSFNVLMEADLVKKPKRKRKHFFGGCLGSQHDDDDDDTYTSENDNTANTLEPLSMSEGVLKEKFALSKTKYYNNEYSSPHYAKKHGILGKCKPGGCLDPPFSEEKYSYEPVEKKKKLTNYIPQDTVKRVVTSKGGEQNIETIHDSKPKIKDTDGNSILSLYEADPLNALDNKYSDSIITYPPETSSSRNVSEQYVKNRISINEEKRKKSVNETADTFFSPSKKTHQRKNSSEKDHYNDKNNYGPDAAKSVNAKVFDVPIRKNLIKRGSGGKVENSVETALSPDYFKDATKINDTLEKSPSIHNHPSNIDSKVLDNTNRRDLKNEMYSYEESPSRPGSPKKAAMSLIEDVSSIHDNSNDHNVPMQKVINRMVISSRGLADFASDSEISLLNPASTINISPNAEITSLKPIKNILRSNLNEIDSDNASFDQNETSKSVLSQTRLINKSGKSVKNASQFRTPTDGAKTIIKQSDIDKEGTSEVENKQPKINKLDNQEMNVFDGNPTKLLTESKLICNTSHDYTPLETSSNLRLKYSFKQTSSTKLIDPAFNPNLENMYTRENISLQLSVKSSLDVKSKPATEHSSKKDFTESNILLDKNQHPQNKNETHREALPIGITTLMAGIMKDSLPAKLTNQNQMSATDLNNVENKRTINANDSNIYKKEPEPSLLLSKNDTLKNQINVDGETHVVVDDIPLKKISGEGSDSIATSQFQSVTNNMVGIASLNPEVDPQIYKKHNKMPNIKDGGTLVEDPIDKSSYKDNAINIIDSNLTHGEIRAGANDSPYTHQFNEDNLLFNKKQTSHTDLKSVTSKDKSDVDATSGNKVSTRVGNEIPVSGSLLQNKNQFPLDSLSHQQSDTLSIQLVSRVQKGVDTVTHQDSAIFNQDSIHMSQTSSKIITAKGTGKSFIISSDEKSNLYLQVANNVPESATEQPILGKAHEKSPHYNVNDTKGTELGNENYESPQKHHMKQEFVDTESLYLQKAVNDYSYSNEKTSQRSSNLSSTLSSHDSKKITEKSKKQGIPQSSPQYENEYISEIQNTASTPITDDSNVVPDDTRDLAYTNSVLKSDFKELDVTHSNSKLHAYKTKKITDPKILRMGLTDDTQSIINNDDDKLIDTASFDAQDLWNTNENISLKSKTIYKRNEQFKPSDTSITSAEKTKTNIFLSPLSIGSSTNTKKSVTSADGIMRTTVDERDATSLNAYGTITSHPERKRLLRNISTTDLDSKNIVQNRDGFNIKGYDSYDKKNLSKTSDILDDFDSKEATPKSDINLKDSSFLSQENKITVSDTLKTTNLPNNYSSHITMSPDIDSKQYSSSVSSRSSLKKDTVTLNVGFQSYINDRKERVIKSIDTSKERQENPDDIVTVIRTQIKPCVNEMRIPIDTEHDMTIQIKRTKSPLRVQISENKQPECGKIYKKDKNLSRIPELNRTLNKTIETSQRVIGPLEMQNILNTIYEKDLIPLQQAIVYLKKEVDTLFKERIPLRTPSRTIIKVKPLRTIRVNQRCCCSKK